MAKRLTVLLLGRASTRLNVLEDMTLGENGLQVTRKLLSRDGHEPLAGVPTMPDVLVLDLAQDSQAVLESTINGIPPAVRPPMIVIGPDGDVDLVRSAMQAGARDYLTDSVSDDEFVASIRRVGTESQLSQKRSQGSLTAVINGKGGSGASFIASSLATLPIASRIHGGSSTALIDLDMDFGDLPVYFDMKSDDGLLRALSTVDELDAVALEGFMRRHESGVQLLAGRHEQIRNRTVFEPRAIPRLLSLACRVYDHVVVDLPRHIDDAIVGALEQADHVVVVMQQTVPHVRDTRFVVGLLRDVGLSNDSIRILVNRFDKKSSVRLDDIEDVFEDLSIDSVPNDYKKVSAAVDSGTPLLLQAPKSPAAKAIVGFGDSLWPAPEAPVAGKARRGSLFSRF